MLGSVDMTQLAYVRPLWLDLCDHSIALHTFLSVLTNSNGCAVCEPAIPLPFAENFSVFGLAPQGRGCRNMLLVLQEPNA
jgi:hypothetical protein